MRLMIDLLALVNVRSAICERRLHGAVRERMKHHSAPQHLAARSQGERRDLLVVLPAEVAVDHQELLQGRPSDSPPSWRPGWRARHARGTRPSIRCGCFRGLGKRPALEVRLRLIAGFVPREHAHRRARPGRHQAKNATRRAGSPTVTPSARRRGRKPGVFDVADPHTRHDISRLRAVNNHLRAAHVDVVMRGQYGHARRLEPDLHVAHRLGSNLPQPKEPGRDAVTVMRAGPVFSAAWRPG